MHNCEKRNKIHVLQHTKVPFFKKRLYILIIHARKVCINLRVSKKNLNFAHFFAVDYCELTHKNLKIVNLQTAFSKNNKTSRILRYKKNMRKLFTKITLLLALLLLSVNSAWGNIVSSTSNHHDHDIQDGIVVLKDAHNHATFTLSGMDIKYKERFGAREIDAYDLGSVGWNSSDYVTLNWTVEEGYEIKVTRIAFWARAYTSSNSRKDDGKVVFNGVTKTAGTIWVSENDNQWAKYDVTKSAGFGNGTQIECKNALTSWISKDYTYDYMIKNLVIEYTITPIINTQNGSVELTICPEAPKTIDLNTCITNKDNHLSYTFSCTAEGANIEETTFSASRIGTYTVNVAVGKEDNCHEAASTSFTVTVTPAALTLTAPTASDITYRQALSASDLTGGSAKVGSCDVAGTWTWKDPKTTPSIGDNQSFPVVFTPSENAGNYTNFETTATINVKRAQFVFDGGGTEDDDPKHVNWCYDENWKDNQIPGSEDQVLIDHNVVIRQEVSVYSVTITEGDTLTIMPTGGLTVGAGGIIGATTGNLILKAGTEGETKGQTGYLRISPEYTGAMPEATVELYTIGYTDMATGDAAYQYVGSPVQGAIAAKTVFNKSVLQAWNEEQGKWYGSRNSLELNPFTGYITTQTRNSLGWLITNAGQLVANENITINLSYTATSAEPGCNVLANSFAAPIDLTKFIDDDFHNIDSTIYLFNTGSRNDMEKKGVDESARGQYLHLPIGSLRAMKKAFKTPTVIAPMQGFCVNALNEGAYITLNYERLVWGGTESNTPLRVKKQEEDLGTAGALCISLVADNMGDNLYLLESEEYDILFENGYDARKRMSGELNVFSIAGNEKLGVDATNSIIGTRVGVRTGAETAYTFVFSHLQSENGLALYDAETEQTIDIDENTEYTFFAAPETEITDRFQIVARADAPAITTGVDGVENEAKAVKFIKDDQIYILKNGVLYNAMGAVVR